MAFAPIASGAGAVEAADRFERVEGADAQLAVARANVVDTRGNQTRFRGLRTYLSAIGPELGAALSSSTRRRTVS